MEIHAATTRGGVSYLISIRNSADVPANLVVVQRFAGRPSSLTASGDGKVEGGIVSWSLQIPPHELSRVSTDAAFASDAPTQSTVCLANPVTSQVVDCAAGDLGPVALAARHFRPQWTVLIGIVLIGIGLTFLTYAAVRWHPRWWPVLRDWLWRRRNALAVVGSGLAVFAIVAGGFLVVAGRAQPFLATEAGTSGQGAGWAGEQHTLEFGRPATSQQAEFTLYQWSCVRQADVAALCVAAVAVRNVSQGSVSWAARMQRLVDRSGHWFEPDTETTLIANGGVDPFATPLKAGERRFAMLAFRPQDPGALTRLELREGAFAAGVSLNLK
jgi:hypothetical protein